MPGGGPLPSLFRAAGHGAGVLSQATATAAEVMRTRRAPLAVAQRRRAAARRRVTAWSIVAIVLLALALEVVVDMARTSVDGASVAAAVFFAGLMVWCLVGVIRAARDLAGRTRLLRALPVSQPSRQPVAGIIRPQMDRLGRYSDSLRELIGMVGIVDDDGTVRAVRDDTLHAADAAERHLRARAVDLSAMVRSAQSPAEKAAIAAARTALVAEISAGVDQYGRLVAATAQAAAASQEYSAVPGPVDPLVDATDRMTALASGMRDLRPSPRASGPSPDR